MTINITQTFINDFKRFFIGRFDAYGIYTSYGVPSCNKTELTDYTIKKHLLKEITIGAYLGWYKEGIDYCKAIVIDIDLHNKNLTKEVIMERLNNHSLTILFDIASRYNISHKNYCRTFSGRGLHIWIKLRDNTELPHAYGFVKVLETYLKQKYSYEPEIFPKQYKIGENGYGNFVKLPLSINKKNGQFCEIMDNFDLSKQGEGHKIPNIIQKISEKKLRDNLKEWKKPTIIENKEDSFYFEQLKPCLQALMKKQLIGKNGNTLRLYITNSLYHIGAPRDVRVRAFLHQKDFNEWKVKYHIRKCEEGVINKQHPMIPSCYKLREMGYCFYKKNGDCPFIKDRFKKYIEKGDIHG